MFLILLTYKKPLEDVDRVVPAHMRWLAEHYAAGDFLLSGRKQPRTGGVILATVPTRAAAEAIARSDPLVSEGMAELDIVEFVASTAAPGLEMFKEL